MEVLFAWLAKEERDPILHPLLRIAVFVVVFLAIHPFQDGNGRLSHILNNLLLLRSGYSFASYSSLESVIEHTKEAYYLALRRTQTTLNTASADWEPWLLFFLHSIQSQIARLRENLDAAEAKIPHREISPLAERLVKLLVERGSLTVAEAASATNTNRNTIKDKFGELAGLGLAELHGKGRGAHYRPADYYKVLAQCDKAGNSNAFIEFLLAAILTALREAGESQPGEQVCAAVSEQVARILKACSASPQSKASLLHAAGLANAYLNYKRHIQPLLAAGLLEMTLPEKPNSRFQQYRLTAKGRSLL